MTLNDNIGKFINDKFGINLNSLYFKDFFGFSYGYFLTSIISFLSIYIVNKNLSPNDLGQYSYLKSIFELLFGVLSLQIYSSYLRFNTKGSNRSLKSIVITIVAIASFVLAIIIYGFTNCVLCSTYALIILYNERVYYFRSLLKIKQLNFARISPTIITLLIMLILIVFYKNLFDYKSIFIAYGIGYLFVVFLYREKNIEIDETKIEKKLILKYCIPIVGVVLVGWVLNLSAQILIKEYFSLSELAYYAVAQRTLLIVKLFTGLFLMFFPMIYYREIKNKNKHLIYKSRNGMILIMLLIILAFFISAKYIYILMGANIYIHHLLIFRILLVSEFFSFFSQLIALFLGFKIQTFKNVVVLSSGAILNLILLMIFLKENGIQFAAYASLLSNILIFVLYYFISYKKEREYLNSTN